MKYTPSPKPIFSFNNYSFLARYFLLFLLVFCSFNLMAQCDDLMADFPNDADPPQIQCSLILGDNTFNGNLNVPGDGGDFYQVQVPAGLQIYEITWACTTDPANVNMGSFNFSNFSSSYNGISSGSINLGGAVFGSGTYNSFVFGSPAFELNWTMVFKVETAPEPPVAAFNGPSQVTICPGGTQTINFQDQSTGNNITSRFWIFSGAGVNPTTSTDQNPTVTVNGTGTLDASLEVTNDGGNNETSTEITIINPEVVACGSSVSGNNDVSVANIDTYGCTGTTTGKEIFYAFDVNSNGAATEISLTGLSTDLDLFLMSACDPASCIFSSRNGGTDDETITEFLDPGTYYVSVDGYDGNTSDFTLNIIFCGCDVPPIVNGEVVWTGCTDTSWENPENWNTGIIPQFNEAVLIPPTDNGNQPILSSFSAVKSVTLANDGTSLTIASGDGVLNIDGNHEIESFGISVGTQSELVNNNFIGIYNMANAGIFLLGEVFNETSGSIVIQKNMSPETGQGIWLDDDDAFFNNNGSILIEEVNDALIVNQSSSRFINNQCAAIYFNAGAQLKLNTGTLENAGFISYVASSATIIGAFTDNAGFIYDEQSTLSLPGINTMTSIIYETFINDNDGDGNSYCSGDTDDIIPICQSWGNLNCGQIVTENVDQRGYWNLWGQDLNIHNHRLFEITPSSSGNLIVNLNDYGSTDLVIYILDGDGCLSNHTILAASTGQQTSHTLNLMVTGGQSYFILVWAYPDEVTTTNFTLEVICADCDNDIILSSTADDYGMNDNIIQLTNEKIIASNNVNPTADVTYSAGTSVELISDFQVATGALFQAIIEGCPGQNLPTLRQSKSSQR